MRFWLFQPFLYHAIHYDPLPTESQHSLDMQPIVEAAMECNVETIRNRTLRHRRHGIWFDIHAIITASFTFTAAAKSGRVAVASEWEDRIKQVIATLASWEAESPDLHKSREVLEELFAETRELIRANARFTTRIDNYGCGDKMQKWKDEVDNELVSELIPEASICSV